MPKKWLSRYLPDRHRLSASGALQPIRHYLQDPEIWHLHRRSVAGAAFIGLFCAFLPVPFQSPLAALFAIGTRCNLPISVVLVWVTNPITIPPLFYFAYRLGAWLLGIDVEIAAIELSWTWLSTQFQVIAYPLILGSLVCGWVAGVSAFVVVRVTWRMHVIQRWRDRAQRRHAKQAKLAATRKSETALKQGAKQS
jgi:uncharacterized protein (DUF2062 family)